jgi:hypothetical protein
MFHKEHSINLIGHLLRDLWRALVNTVLNLWVTQNAEEVFGSCKTGGLLRS